MCVMWCSRMSGKINAGSTRRRHTLVPAMSAIVQGKHQPLQWNMGSVHRYVAWCGSCQLMTLLAALRYAPRWWVTTPLGLPVVPEV